MKLLFLMLMLISTPIYANINLGSSSSTNTSQQTGGNYIYAENGKLTFNFEPSLFENRTWQYDASKDSAVTAFETNLPIKTKYSSTFHGYEVADNGQITLVAYYDESKQTPMLTKPIYRKGYEGRTVHVWLPAAGWLVRVVGAVARAVVPPIVTRCLTNAKCASFVLPTATIICGINFLWGNKDEPEGFLREFGFPEGICERAEEEGWRKNEKGQYVRDYKYKATVRFGREPSSDCTPEEYKICSPEYRVETIGGDSEEELIRKLEARCKRQIGTSYTNIDDSSDGAGLSGTIIKAEFIKNGNNTFSCNTLAQDEEGTFESPGASFQADIDADGHKETLQFVDLENLVSKDFQKNPNDYINEKGQIGKEIREKINSSAAIMKKDGTPGNIALSSDPYKNPETGETQQDLLSISSGTSTWTTPDNGNSTDGSGIGGSGGNSSGSSGSVPTGTNGVTMQTISRPDQSGSAKPAENNSPNGTGTGTSGGAIDGTSGTNTGGSTGNTGTTNGSTNGSENGSASGISKGLDCSGEHKGTLACASVGEATESSFDGIEIPTKTDKTTYSADGFLPSNGVCPAPKVFHVVGKPYEISYEPLCNIATQIRFAVLLSFAVMSSLVAFGGLKKG